MYLIDKCGVNYQIILKIKLKALIEVDLVKIVKQFNVDHSTLKSKNT